MIELNEKSIPKDWKWVKLSEVAIKITDGEHFRPRTTTSGIPFLSAKDIRHEGISFNNPLFISEETAKKALQRCNPEKGDILIVSRGASIGRMCIVKTDKTFCLLGSVILIKVNRSINNHFINYFLKSPIANQKMIAVSGATAQQAIYLRDIKSIEIPLPPKSIQEVIVSKIEELFSELDKGIENMRTAQQQLKTYRQAVLKWAFEGRLTNEIVKDGELPKRWKTTFLKDVCEIKRGKSKHRPRNAHELYGGKFPFIQTGDIRNASGKYLMEYSQTYSELGLKQSKLWPKGTLCITIAANIGETAILGFDACFPDSVVGLLTNENLLLNKYLNYYFIFFKQKLGELAPATAQKNINVEILEKVKVPLAPIMEQYEIIKEIEGRISIADKIEEGIIQSLQLSVVLRQSILKKAFKGEII